MEKPKTVKILKFHPEKCDGQKGCEIACSQVHFKSDEGGSKSAIRIIKTKNGVVWLDKNICIGCQACVGFCPVGAMRKSDVRIEPFKCISCGACVKACPHGALELVEVDIDDIKKVVYHKQGVD